MNNVQKRRNVIPEGIVGQRKQDILSEPKNKFLKIDGKNIKFKLVENILNKNINFYTWKSIEGNKGSFANGAVKKYKSTNEPTAASTPNKEELNFVLEFGGSGPKITVYERNFGSKSYEVQPSKNNGRIINLQKHINDNAYADDEKKIKKKKKEYESEEKEFFNQTKISDGIIRFQTLKGLELILEYLTTKEKYVIKHLIVIVSGGHATKHNDYPYERGEDYLQEGKRVGGEGNLKVFFTKTETDYGYEKNKMIESIKATNICLYGPKNEAIFEISEGYSILVSENAKVTEEEKINIDGDTVFFTGGSTTFQIGLITKEKITKEKITTEEIGVIEEDGITSDGKKKNLCNKFKATLLRTL